MMISSASTNHPFLSRIKRKKNGRYGITVITFKPGEWQQLVGILEALLLSVLPQHPYLIQEPNTTTTHHISTPQNHQDLQEPKKKNIDLALAPTRGAMASGNRTRWGRGNPRAFPSWFLLARTCMEYLSMRMDHWLVPETKDCPARIRRVLVSGLWRRLVMRREPQGGCGVDLESGEWRATDCRSLEH